MKAFTTVFKAYFKGFIRDKGALFFTFIFPIMFILIFGWAFQNPGVQTFKVGLVDQGSPQSAAFIEQGLVSIIVNQDQKVFEIKKGTQDELTESLRKGDLAAVIVIPQTMDASLSQGQRADIEVYYDASRTSSQQILIPMLNQVINAIDRQLQGGSQLIGMAETSIQTPDLRYIDYLVPGILAMSLMFTGVYAGLPIIQQRQAHIIKRLGATPLRRSMLVFGDLSFRMLGVLLTAGLIVLVGRLAFNVHMVGNWFSFCALVILGTLTFTSLGYLMAAFVKTEEAAIPIINVITMPMMFLSGTFFEVTNMPSFIEPVVKVMPLTYLGDGM
ncbi:MAG: ABC transporter permease, partial [Chloroflexi bacterium]|nr:ABC transporter permease [Chloroflexota bacterium]